MSSSVLTFAQGQLATFTAQFVTTPAGMPVNVPDATLEIFGTGGASVFGPVPMVLVVTGLYYYDWTIPNSFPVDTYTARFTGTVLGTPTANTIYVNIVLPGGASSQTAGQARAVAALERYVHCVQRIPVEAELGRVRASRDEVFFNWQRWNLTNPIIQLNDNIIESGYTIDYDNGILRFDSPLHSTDKVDATYNFRFFSNEDMVGFLSDALNMINLEPSGSNYTLDQLPDQVIGPLLSGAAANVLKSMMFCLMFQKPSTVFGGMDRAKEIFANMETLKQNHQKVFDDAKRKVKISNWPRIAANVSPEFTLPGGRSRWFRYLFSSNVS